MKERIQKYKTVGKSTDGDAFPLVLPQMRDHLFAVYRVLYLHFWIDDKRQRNEKLLKPIWRRQFLQVLEVHVVTMKIKIFMKL